MKENVMEILFIRERFRFFSFVFFIVKFFFEFFEFFFRGFIHIIFSLNNQTKFFVEKKVDSQFNKPVQHLSLPEYKIVTYFVHHFLM